MNAPAKLPELVTESYLIPSDDAGIELYVRNKRPAGITGFAADKILLYVHGATYPSETAFDLPIEGASMMDLIASRGHDVYLVDIRGYGRSTRPPEMGRPPQRKQADRLDGSRGTRFRSRRRPCPEAPRRRPDQSDG